MSKIEILSIENIEQTHTVEIPVGVDFVYIMRKDSVYIANKIAQSVAQDYGLAIDAVQPIIFAEYEDFTTKLASALAEAFNPKGNVELHLFEAESLEAAERQKAGVLPIVSLDPLLEEKVTSLCVSRGFYQGGIKDFGQIARPGSAPLDVQAQKIKEEIGELPVCVVEDDIFSGGSVISALEHLQAAGVKIAKLIPGFQIGKPGKLEAMGIKVDPVINYKTADNTDIFSKVDLGDPRDYLLGASGLVVSLSNGFHGRVPYLLPFVSTSARAGVPEENEVALALKAWQLNSEFFAKVEQALGKPLLLKHLDPYFIEYMEVEHGISSEFPMKELITWVVEKLNKEHSQIKEFGLPQKLIFLDVNGTILPDEAQNGDLDQDQLLQFQKEVKSKIAAGFAVGLCSDSPLPQLISFAQKLGLGDAPIIAENGNLIYFQGKKFVVKALDSLQVIKSKIIEASQADEYQQIDDVVAVEFGGHLPDYNAGEWAFGAGREASISVFGNSLQISALGLMLEDLPDVSIDCSHEYNYLGIHPGKYKENKGLLLAKLAGLGHDVTMVGNSKSDWVDPVSGVSCAFVGESRITPEIAQNAALVAVLPTLQGVIEILQTI